MKLGHTVYEIEKYDSYEDAECLTNEMTQGNRLDGDRELIFLRSFLLCFRTDRHHGSGGDGCREYGVYHDLLHGTKKHSLRVMTS